ncbi:hypothetical protein GTY86_26955, partial [Streptomyces sp. SID5770]|nr:hypothetical protein [Streptomyces sp. SID5770]
MTPVDTASAPLAARALLALVVVLVLLATTGWTTVRHQPPPGPSREAALAAWAGERVGGRPLPGP